MRALYVLSAGVLSSLLAILIRVYNDQTGYFLPIALTALVTLNLKLLVMTVRAYSRLDPLPPPFHSKSDPADMENVIYTDFTRVSETDV